MFRHSVHHKDVRKLLQKSTELELSAASILRLKWFLYALEHECNVSLTCRHFDISRSTFLRWANRFDAGDISTLTDESRRPKTVRKPETDARTIEIIRPIRLKEPMLGKEGIVSKLKAEFGITISSSTVGRIITRHRFFFANTKAHTEKRSTREATEVSFELPRTPELSNTSPATGALPVTSDEDDLSSFFPVMGLTS